MRVLSLLSCLLTVTGSVRARAQTARDEVHHRDEARRDALLRGDPDALSRILADEFVEIGPNGYRSKAINVDDLRSKRLRWAHLVVSEERITVFDSTSATLTGVLEGDGTAQGRPFARRSRFLRVYLKRRGVWENVAAANVPLPPLAQGSSRPLPYNER